MIYQQKGFLSKEELDKINSYLDNTDSWEKIANNPLWDGRCINVDRYSDVDITPFMVGINNKIENKIVEVFNLTDKIYPSLFQFCRSFKMKSATPHSDSTGNLGEDNGTSHRHFSSILYLNKSFSGGNLFFPNQDLTVSPEPGLLVIFPSTHEYMHGVTEIFDGIRLTMLNFWTYDIQKANAYNSLKTKGYYGN